MLVRKQSPDFDDSLAGARGDPPARPLVSATARSPFRELLLVLSLTWVALAVYAWSDWSLTVGEFTLAKIDLEAPVVPARPALAATPPQPTAATKPAAKPEPSSKVGEPARPVVDPAPQRILIVGDSMVINMLQRLGDYCRENGHELLPAVWYGSTTQAWAGQNKLDQLIQEFRPTFVIISLGASEVLARAPASRDHFVRTIVNKVGDRKLLWIGPPDPRADTYGLDAMLARTVGRGRYFRSVDLTLPREADGVHPTPKGGRMWLEAIRTWILAESSVAIRLDTPTSEGPRPAARVYPPPY
jgi:hypothetical protein